MRASSFYAGAAAVEVTPPLGTLINGDFIAHYARYVHDPLYAKALVLKQPNAMVAIVVVDICAMTAPFLDDIKAVIFQRTGIPVENILISSTHTHAAGSVTDVHLSGADLGYRQQLPGLIVQAVVAACEKLRPAKLGWGDVDAPEHMVCRRYRMQEGYLAYNPVTGMADEVKTNPVGDEKMIMNRVAVPDPQLSYLAIQGTDSSWIALLGNYGLHYVGDWENGTLSADYFGVFSRHMRELLQADDNFIAMMSNGTSGDVNIWDFLDDTRYPKAHFKKSEMIGNALAQKVFHSVSEIIWEDDPVLAALYDTVPVTARKPAAAELEEAKRRVAQTAYENIEANGEGLKSIYAREQVLLNEYPDQLGCQVQALRIGSGVIGGLAGEFFASTGLWLKAQSPIRYFTISLANGNAGYVPPAHEMAKGGYETWRCRISCLEIAAEDIIRKRLLQMIQQLA
ncbi:hypothetical protein [Chitinophaga defluvii]|uniref:Neutral/alkaline ceramidase-like enzyme n=1 Tax=Chitinophaga defluvii TaxID=3163343 RepID=A0ABV2T1L6_9BACT